MTRYRIRQIFLFCCIWGVFLCSGFVAIGSSYRWRKNDGKKQRLTFSKHAALYDNGDHIYPTDTLQNIGLNFTQSLVPDIAYYYLQNTIGLSEETMWKITLEAGSVLGMTPRNLEKKISLLRRTMNLSDEDIRIILSKQPAILHYSAERNLGTTIIFLVRALDLSKQELRTMVLDSPSILGYSVDNLGRKLSFFGNTLGYMDNVDKVDRMERVRNLLVGTPKLLLSAVETGLMPRFQFLRNEIEFSLEELQLLYEKNPRLLLYSLDGNMREKIVFFFILQLHIEPENVRKLLLSFPKIMDYNLENHKKPIAEYYITELGFSNSELGSIVTRFPRLFSYSLFKLKHVTGFLRFELGLDATQVKRVIFQAPQIVGLDTEGTLKKKLDLLQTRLSLTSNELGLVVSKMPTLMNLGTENNLLSKIKYLERVENHDAVKTMILKQPTLLGYSLEKRIRPRMEKILTAGLSADKVTVGISMTESKFQGWLESSRLRLKREVDEGAQNVSRSRLSYLTEVLDLNQTEVDTFLAKMPGLKYIRANKMFQRRIDYFITELQNSTIATKSILIEKPLLLKHSIKKEWEPRMQKIREAGISDPQKTVTLLSMPNAEFGNWSRESEYSKTLELLRSSSIHFSQDDVDIFLQNLAGVTMSDVNLVEAIKFLLEISSDSELDSVKMNVRDKPHLLATPRALEDRISARESQLSEVTTIHLDKISTIMMSQEEFDAIHLLNQKLNFTDKEMDFIISRQPKSNFPTDLAAKLDCLMSRDFGVGADIAILARPNLLSYHIDKIQNMTTVLLTRRNKAKHLYEEETLDMLVAFGHTKGDASDIFYGSKVLGIRHPEMLLKPKLDMLLSAWEQRDIIAFALAKPLLYDKSVTELALLVKTGMLPSNTDNITPLVADEIKAGLNLTDIECAHIFPMNEPDIQLKSTYEYLPVQFSSSREDLKRLLLSEPNILSLPVSQVEPRMELLLEWGCDPANIVFVAFLSRRKAEEFCMKSYLQREFDLSQKQVDLLLQKVLTNRQSVGSLLQKFEYLLPNAFQGSRKKMKRELLKNTSILTQSMALLEARIETLQLLEAVGFDVTEYGPLLSMSRSEFTNEFLPQRKSWSPMSTSEMGRTSLTTQTNALAADVREMMSSSLAISFSDDENRDVASVVQWRC